ncbi:E3 ubiquitin-protein ligase RNF169 isoform X2 [Hippocampus zosterae]|uniref:E3 ubiquitin-protein ligase RNF169 isoform X2 n=1 Tax=Hippocampus zosterae TaxID=109293 RepID=UPI00223D774F|nr:E3 ubiquitin-protein ligase RNF169 isoform X2 [Hippocampus zosterae]
MAAAGTGRRSGKAAAAAAAARSSLGLGPASAFVGREHARSSSASGRSRSARGRRGAEAKRRGGGGGTAVVGDAADPRTRRSDVFVCPCTVHKSTEGSSSGANAKRKLSACDQREDARRRSLPKEESGALQCGEQSKNGTRALEFFLHRPSVPSGLAVDGYFEAETRIRTRGVLSDSENEEPVSRRIRRFSAFVRRSRASSGVSSGAPRSRSCTEAGDGARGKSKGGSAPARTAGAAHSFAAGILLSSENSRSASAPVGGRERRPAAAPPAPSAAPSTTPSAAPPERSVSPESNDSISEELNHFKPIVCSPCTPPKRLADGRLLEPAVVKATPRNLSWRLHKPTSYEASPAVLQRWRQIELDRQSFKVDSKATLTSPVAETREAAGAPPPFNKRKLLFDDAPALKIRVPAVRRRAEPAFRADRQSEPGPGPGVGALFGRRHSFSPCARKSGFRSCKLAPKDSPSPREETAASQRGGKTKRRDDDDAAAADPRVCDAARQERKDRALALKLQRRFDRESAPRPDKYFLRSWMANRGRRRRGLRRSCRISQRR